MARRRTRVPPIATQLLAATVTIMLVTGAAPTPAAAAGDDEAPRPQSWFVDTNGGVHDFVPTYEAWIDRQRRPNYLRAAVEALIVTGIGTAIYWIHSESSRQDWDDPPLVEKLRLEAFSLDSNANHTNHLFHPIVGSVMQSTARANGLSIPAAIALSTVSSLTWEFLLEWREQASINDVIYTVGGGIPLGELILHLDDYFNSAPYPRTGHKVAANTFGVVRAVHVALDDEELPEPLPPDSLGFSSAFAHAFRIAYEGGYVANDAHEQGSLHGGALDAVIIGMPGFLGQGVIDTGFSESNFTEGHLRIAAGTGGTNVDLRAAATLAGHYRQTFATAQHGYATMVGVGSALRFQQSNLLDRRDQLSALHVVGPHLGLWGASGPIGASLLADAHLDFASLRSLAYQVWEPVFGSEGLKTVLQKQEYTYQLGISARVRGMLAAGPLTLDGYVEYGRYESIEGTDRHQHSVTRDVHHTESVLELGATARLHASIAELGLGVAGRLRGSTMGPVSVDRSDRFVHLSIGLSF